MSERKNSLNRRQNNAAQPHARPRLDRGPRNTLVLGLTNVRNGRIWVLARAEGHAERSTPLINLAAQDVASVDIILPTGFAIHGHVSAPDNTPAANALVNLQPDFDVSDATTSVFHYMNMNMSFNNPFGSTFTDSHGDFAFPPVMERPYTLYLHWLPNPWWMEHTSASAFPMGEAENLRFGVPVQELLDQLKQLDNVTPEEEQDYGEELAQMKEELRKQVDELKQEPLLVEGVVLAADGKPASPAFVSTNLEYNEFINQAPKSFYTDLRGRFRFRLPRAPLFSMDPDSTTGPVHLALTAIDPEGRSGRYVADVPKSASALKIEIRMEEGPKIEGTVKNDSGQPVPGAQVLVFEDRRFRENEFPVESGRVVTSSDGRFRVYGLDQNKHYQIGAWATGYGIGFVKQVAPYSAGQTIVLPKEAVIKGKVVSPDGQPASGAVVSGKPASGDAGFLLFSGRRQQSNAVSDRNGLFELHHVATLGAANWSLTAQSGSFQTGAPVTAAVSPGQTTEGLVLALAGGVSISGLVVDKTTQAPISDARIAHAEDGEVSLLSTSNAQGAFQLDMPQPRHLRLVVAASGYVSIGMNGKSIKELQPKGGESIKDLLFEMSPAGLIAGVVHDASGTPLGGVKIGVTAPDEFPYILVTGGGFNPESNVAYTGEDGRFVIGGIPPGVQAWAGFTYNGMRYERIWTAPAEPMREPEDVIVGVFSSVAGMVVDSTGRPMTDGVVTLQRYVGDAMTGDRPGAKIVEGTFKFERLQPGLYVAEYGRTSSDYSDKTEKLAVRPGENKTGVRIVAINTLRPKLVSQEKPADRASGKVDLSNLNLPALAPGQIYGTVKPIYHSRGYEDRYVCKIGTPVTDFSFPNPFGNRVKMDILAQFTGLAPVFIADVTVPTSDLIITTRNQGRMEGKVVNAETGAPVLDFEIGILYPWSPAKTVWKSYYNGEYALEGLGDFTIAIQIRAPGLAPTGWEPIACSSDRTQTRLPVRLGKGMTAHGRIVNEDGTPVAAAKIVIEDATFGFGASEWGRTVSGVDGTFTLDGLRLGTAFLNIGHPDYQSLQNKKVLLAPGKIDDLEFVLKKAGILEIWVKNDEHALQENAKVFCNGRPVPYVAGKRKWVLDDAPAETVSITVDPYEPGMEKLVHEMTIAVNTTSVYTFEGTGTKKTNAPIELTGAYSEGFDAMPDWTSQYEGVWGGRGTWTIKPGGQQGSFLEGTQDKAGSSVRVMVFSVRPGSKVEISAWMKAPASDTQYWMEFACRQGNNNAENFEKEGGQWKVIGKYDSKVNPGGTEDAWKQVSAVVDTGVLTEISVGIKMGSLGGPCPPVGFDTLIVR